MKNYQFVSATSKAVVIRDKNTGVSVTNSIEKVLSHFEKEHETIGRRRFFYYDSDGCLTEAIHNHGRFCEFRHPINVPSELCC